MQLLKRPWLALLALIGIHEHLSAQQKQDIGTAAMQATPGSASTGALLMNGVEAADVVAVLTAIFVALQIAHLIYKWRRQVRIDADKREQGEDLQSTDLGSL